MSNMLDYIRWRGDLSLRAVPLCEVDGLILSQLSMIHWEHWLNPGESAALASVANRLEGVQVSAGFTGANDAQLMALATHSERFGGIRVCGYTQAFDPGDEMQFSAISLLLPDDTLFLSFRGTDSTLVGWKEDFNMAYSKPVPAQEAAADYLRRAARWFPGIIRVGGHSKGGNLAVYAAATADEAVLTRLTDVYNNDGPGLSDQIDAHARYARLGGRLHSFVPQSSMVGMLLSHPDTFEVVRSDSVSILQHNPYSWQVEGGRFVRAAGLNRDSVHFESVFRKWLSGVDETHREALVETLFGILGASDAERFDGRYLAGLLRSPRVLINAVQRIPPEARKDALQALSNLAEIALRPGAGERDPRKNDPS